MLSGALSFSDATASAFGFPPWVPILKSGTKHTLNPAEAVANQKVAEYGCVTLSQYDDKLGCCCTELKIAVAMPKPIVMQSFATVWKIPPATLCW